MQQEQQDQPTVDLEQQPYIIHGSHDSLDKDVIYYVLRKVNPTAYDLRLLELFNPFSLDFQYNQRILYNFCAANTHVENRNVIVIDEMYGFVTECYKGTPDAINNQLLYTFGSHRQMMDVCPVRNFAERDVVLKITRSVRHLLGSVGQICHKEKDETSPLRTTVRPMLRNCLRSLDFQERLNVLSQIDFSMVLAPKSVEQMKDFEYVSLLKSVVFQLIQTIAQFDYIEIYSKQTAVEFDPRSNTFIYRKWMENPVSLEEAKDQLQLFNEYRDLIVQKCRMVKVEKLTKTIVRFSIDQQASDEQNALVRQSKGHLVDMARERCILFSIDIPFATRSTMIEAMKDYNNKIAKLQNVINTDQGSVITSAKLIHYFKNLPLIAAYQLESSIHCQWIDFGNKKKNAEQETITTQVCTLLRSNQHGIDYDWLRFYYVVAYNTETNEVIPLLKRNQCSFKIDLLEAIDDRTEVQLENLTSSTNSAYLLHGRLFVTTEDSVESK